jgi:HAE1 family hydrophobic/amphiphilic exporter-1
LSLSEPFLFHTRRGFVPAHRPPDCCCHDGEPRRSPTQVETEISDKIEASINTISGIDELRSTSTEGVSTVIATFLLEKNGDVAAQEVRDKVNLVVPDLPETAEQSVIQKVDPDAAPVLRIAVSAPSPLRDVTDVADKKIKKQIESISGVGQVQIVGGSRREIKSTSIPNACELTN